MRRTFDGQGLLAINPDALGFMFGMAEHPEMPFKRKGEMAVVEIDGPLDQSDDGWWDSYEAIRKRCDAAYDDQESKTVCLKINSPGGMVAGCFELCDHLHKRAEGKPTVAYVDGQATSAAYALACCAGKVYAPASGMVGSVGVIARLMSMTGMAEQAGVKAAVVTSGARKSDGHPLVPITEDAVKALQGTVDAMASVFFEHVAMCRKMTPEAVKALDAAVLMGSAAKDAGLCDEVGNFDDVTRKHGGESESTGTGSTVGAAAASDTGAAEAITKTPADGQSAPRGTAAGRKRNAMRDALVLALGLKADAQEVDVLGAVTALQSDRREVLSLTGKPSMAEALGTIQGWHASAERLPAVESRVAELEARDVERERDALIAKHSDPATANCKLAPSMIEWAKAQSVEALRAFVAVAPSLTHAATTLPAAPEVKPSLTDAQRKAAASAGIPEDKFAAELKRLGGE